MEWINRKSTKYNRRVVQFSVPRSGSVFIYQILKMIFSGGSTHHNYVSNADLIIYRNFLDSALSQYRVINNKESFFIDNENELVELINYHIPFVSSLLRYRTKLNNLLVFSYENDIYLPDGGNNYDRIFKKMENYFGIKINNRDAIIENTSFFLNKKRSKIFNTFDDYDKETFIHGKHVFDGGVGMWKKYISEDLHSFYLDSKLGVLNNSWKKVVNRYL